MAYPLAALMCVLTVGEGWSAINDSLKHVASHTHTHAHKYMNAYTALT